MTMYNVEHINVGVNNVTNCCDWANNRYAAFGGGNLVALYDVLESKVVKTLPGHRGRVNTVRWVNQPNQKKEIITGGTDGLVLVWTQEEEENHDSWQVTAILRDHKDSVTGVDSIVFEDGNKLLIASCSGDNTVKLWLRKTQEDGTVSWEKLQTLDSFGTRMPLCVSLSFLPNSNYPVLAVGAADRNIHLFTQLGEDGLFGRVEKLTGHEDWVKSIKFLTTESGDILMATASQDCRIRVWRFVKNTGEDTILRPSEILQRISDHIENEGVMDLDEYIEISNQGYNIKTNGESFSIILESLLPGHEEWTSEVSWAPPIIDNNGEKIQPVELLSCSMDRTMIIWEPDEESGLWIEKARVGDVGGNHLGFLGCSYGNNGEYILGYSHVGSIHIWKNNKEEEDWEPINTVSGHFDNVVDISWDNENNYLMSVSKDQTTRIFAPILPNDIWHEIARPQVHGYDMKCFTCIPGQPHRIVSAAEEKVMRLLDGPKSFFYSLENLTGIVANPEETRPESANIPPLNLSNKPVYRSKTGEIEHVEEKPKFGYIDYDMDNTRDGHIPLILEGPPFEQQLRQRTLWAELQKLYGHGNNMYALCSNYKGNLIASSCIALVQSAEEAVVRFWDTTNWKQLFNARSSQLTVVQMEFSHDDKYLLTVSRDRSIGLIEINYDGDVPEAVNSFIHKKHSRIIWGCGWSHDDHFFATASRDKSVKVWTHNGEGDINMEAKITFKQAATAVAWAPVGAEDGYILAIGLENGSIKLYKYIDSNCEEWITINTNDAHADTVKRLKWRTIDGRLQLASCSLDHSIRVFNIMQ
eukprot:TRINITY_DN8379_c0_g1_i1.p1 TRINITY_DN8379_c0_g1~~TRINITY_DN8379_c0_g1_i1.p1  ORF type:complete len:810 (-),score=215.16 TRINITY_DN8379_c0_g1_i1:48-2477(-)